MRSLGLWSQESRGGQTGAVHGAGWRAFRGHFGETEARETAAEIKVVRLLLVGSSREACRQLVTVCQGNRNLRRQELLGFVQSRKRRRGFVKKPRIVTKNAHRAETPGDGLNFSEMSSNGFRTDRQLRRAYVADLDIHGSSCCRRRSWL